MFRSHPLRLSALALGFAASTLLGHAQSTPPPAPPKIDFPAPSPTATVKQRVGLTDIEIIYSRPGMKGRSIFGGIIAFGEVWRTGANNATRLTFGTPVKIEGQSLDAGTYELFTIPTPTTWTVIFQKAAKQWGAYAYKAENDVLRITVTPTALTAPVETFTIGLDDVRNESATLTFTWEKTRVPVKLTVDVASTLVPQIEAALASGATLPNGVAFNAAQFLYDKELDAKKALTLITMATNNDKPAFYMVHLKAKILARLGDKAAAKDAAELSSKLAIAAEGPKSPFVTMNHDLIASLK